MISQRVRENRRVRALKLPKNIERLYKEGKCRDCAVVVTRMDFAKILGKFTKVKIQYENSSTSKTKRNVEPASSNSINRLKSNENGMVLLHRNAYSQHPVKELLGTKKPKSALSTKQSSNVLKENNRLKKTPIVKDKNSNISTSRCNETKKKNSSQLKEYKIIFTNPTSNNNKIDIKSKMSLQDLIPLVDKSILPSKDWCIDYLPHSEEPTNDKVYDRIAAELEDLMYNEKPAIKTEKKSKHKVDDFPSIMDILNDNSNEIIKANDQSTTIGYKPNLESSDVEAMLLGKSDTASKQLQSDPMEVDNADMSKLIDDVAQLNSIQAVVSDQDSTVKIPVPIVDAIDNPHSPSILDEALQKGIEEHLPCDPDIAKAKLGIKSEKETAGNFGKAHSGKAIKDQKCSGEGENNRYTKSYGDGKIYLPTNITHLIIKKNFNGECLKCVTCPKNLNYSVELEGKSVDFLGAPKLISSLEDLKVLLQIVNETELKDLYVCH